MRAAVEIARSDDGAADQLLGSIANYAGAHLYWTMYWGNRLRGSLLVRDKRFRDAVTEFDTIRRNRGWNPTSPLFPLAHLDLARAAALAGDVTMSRKAYEELLTLWKDADPDLPQRIAAQRKLQQLGK